MRLTCPNCSARYEVDDSLIPPEGRDVQCSNCATTWFQPGNRARVEDPEEAPAASAAAAAPPRRDLDPALRDILREEREREEQLRRAAAPVEEQEEMALDSPPPAARTSEPTEDDAGGDEGEDADAAAIRDMVAEDTGGRGRQGAREMFPDIEEINSTLRATTDRNSSDRDTTDIDSMDVRPRRRRGFRTGFGLMILLAAAAIGLYAYQEDVTAAVPQAEPYVSRYVSQVDQLRFRLDDLVQSLANRLQTSAEN